MIFCPGFVDGMPPVLPESSPARCPCEMIVCPGTVAGMPVVLQGSSLARCLCEMISFPGIFVGIPVAVRATCLAIVVCVVHAAPGKQTVVLDSSAPIFVVYFPSGSSGLPVVRVTCCSIFVAWLPAAPATCFDSRHPVRRFLR